MTKTQLQTSIKQVGHLIENAHTILVLQPERPDSDSLCSALTLEHLLGDLGKTVVMYSKDKLPTYIDYFPGADRLVPELPNQFDLTILVDTGGAQQIGRTLEKYQGRLAAKPFVILDHHATREPLPFATTDIIMPEAAATGELLVHVSRELGWAINKDAAPLIVAAIMADTLGLTTPSVTPATIQIVADMATLGANLYELNQARLTAGALEPDVLALKGRLLQEVEFLCDDRLAFLSVDPATLKEFAKRYDPAALVIYDMQHVRGVEIAIVLRNYSPKIKLSLRSNQPIASQIASTFGGGGHPQASGVTIESGDPNDIRAKIISETKEALANLASTTE